MENTEKTAEKTFDEASIEIEGDEIEVDEADVGMYEADGTETREGETEASVTGCAAGEPETEGTINTPTAEKTAASGKSSAALAEESTSASGKSSAAHSPAETTGLFDSVAADVREFFRKIGITASEAKIRDLDMRLARIQNYVPKIGFFGKTGAGKSSLCNVLFGADTCKVGHAGSVTRDIQELAITVRGKKIVLVDVPGVGEDRKRDREYYDLYRRLLPSLDIVIWVQKADDRAFTDVQNAYMKVFKPYFDAHPTLHIPFVIALNQVDKVEPAVIEQDGQLTIAWNTQENCPSEEQQSTIEDIIVNIGSKIAVGDSYIVPVSASRKYNLYRLIRAMLRELPAEKISIGDAFCPDLNLSKPKKKKTGRIDWSEWFRGKMKKVASAMTDSDAEKAADASKKSAGDAEEPEVDVEVEGADTAADEELWEDEIIDGDDLADDEDLDDDEDCDDDDEYGEDDDEAEETREMLRYKRWEAVKETIGAVFGAVAEGGKAVIRGVKRFAGWVASKLFG